MAAVMYPIAYFMYMKGYTTGKAGVEAILSGGKDETADSGSVHYGRNSVRVSDGKLC